MNRFARLSAPHAFATALLFSLIAVAAEKTPVAVVEDVSAGAADLQFMDLLEQGRVIKLGDGQNITLGYLRSCTREIVTGGTITVGRDASEVAGGAIERELVDCDGATCSCRQPVNQVPERPAADERDYLAGTARWRKGSPRNRCREQCRRSCREEHRAGAGRAVHCDSGRPQSRVPDFPRGEPRGCFRPRPPTGFLSSPHLKLGCVEPARLPS